MSSEEEGEKCCKAKPEKSESMEMVKFIFAMVATLVLIIAIIGAVRWVRDVNEESVSRRIADAVAEAKKYPEERVKDLESQSHDATREYNHLFEQKCDLEEKNRRLKKELDKYKGP